MVGNEHAEMQPGELAGETGAARFRQLMRREAIVRCGDLWMAQASHGRGDEIEIEIYCGFESRSDRWAIEVYYFSTERALAALCDYERTGNMPEGE